MSVYIPTRWIVFDRVHERNNTCATACVIHNPSDHHMRYWPLHWRNDRGIFERICTHGVGHPDPDQFYYWKGSNQEWQTVHGCDGCCHDISEAISEGGETCLSSGF